MNQSYLKYFLLSFIIIWASSCNEDESDYQPVLTGVNDLAYEFNNLRLTVNESISRIDTCTSSTIFNLNFEVFNQDKEKIDILIADAEKKLADTTLSSGEQAQLDQLYESMLTSKEQWLSLNNQLSELQKQDIKLLFAFNTIKDFLFHPTYASEASLDEIYQSNLVFSNHPSAKELLYFKDREDITFILEFAQNIRDIEKIYQFCFYAIKAYDVRLVLSSYELYIDKLKSQLVLIENISNKNTRYNLYLKNRLNVSNSKQLYELNDLIYFAENIHNAKSLLSSYLSIQRYERIFENNNDEFMELSDSLAQYATRIALIETHDTLFDAFFGKTYSDFSQLIFFSNNADSLALWKDRYLGIVEQVDGLFSQYKDAESIDDEQDKTVVLKLKQERATLLQSYDVHFTGYKHFLQDFYADLQAFISTESTGEKLDFLVNLMD